MDQPHFEFVRALVQGEAVRYRVESRCTYVHSLAPLIRFGTDVTMTAETVRSDGSAKVKVFFNDASVWEGDSVAQKSVLNDESYEFEIAPRNLKLVLASKDALKDFGAHRGMPVVVEEDWQVNYADLLASLVYGKRVPESSRSRFVLESIRDHGKIAQFRFCEACISSPDKIFVNGWLDWDLDLSLPVRTHSTGHLVSKDPAKEFWFSIDQKLMEIDIPGKAPQPGPGF